MASSTSTPAALSSEAHALSGNRWRLVEAQHRVSTLKVVDTVEEQAVLVGAPYLASLKLTTVVPQ
jgi:hypothetical protein